MKKLKYKSLVFGILPCDLQGIKEIAEHLFGSSHGSWMVEDEGYMLTVVSFAKWQDRETFSKLLESLPNPDDESDAR